jgi:hypothetical protein
VVIARFLLSNKSLLFSLPVWICALVCIAEPADQQNNTSSLLQGMC